MVTTLHRLSDARHRVSRGLHELAAALPADPVRPDHVPAPAPAARRVRHQVRDGAAVMVFSAAASTGLALTLLLLASLAS
jgi:hypothetical protein